jgi:uncharacterized protein
MVSTLLFVLVLAACGGSAGAPSSSDDVSGYASSEESAVSQPSASAYTASSEPAATGGTASASASSEASATASATATVSASSESYAEETGEATASIPAEAQQALAELSEIAPATVGTASATASATAAPIVNAPQDITVEEYYRAVASDLDAKWAGGFGAEGLPYSSPNLEFYSGTSAPATNCGPLTYLSSFYCPPEQIIYFKTDLNLEQAYQFGGHFVMAWIAAHEWAHHVQNLLGVRKGENAWSIEVELHADCLAGVWANSVYYEGLLEPGDIEAAIAYLSNTGDFPGMSPYDPNAHGTPEQQVEWFLHGYQTGDPGQCQTY